MVNAILASKRAHLEHVAIQVEALVNLEGKQFPAFLRSCIPEGDNYEIPNFYGIPKIHKNPVKMRPIIPCHSAIMNPAAKFVSKKLKPLIKIAHTIIHGTKDLAIKLSRVNLNHQRSWWLVTGDVVAFYPNIPLQRCMDIVYDLYEEYLWQTMDPRSETTKVLLKVFKQCLYIGNTRLMTKFHHSQFPAMPFLATKPVTANGVSAAKVVATIDVPASHQGMFRPDKKNSLVLPCARRE